MTKELISVTRSGVVRFSFIKNGEQIGSGSGFLSSGYVITNSHVIRAGSFDAVEITFGDQDVNPITPIRYTPDILYGFIVNESPEDEFDYVIFKIDEPELNGRFQFKIRAFKYETVGEQVLFFGFPFGFSHMTSHVGYISADYQEERRRIFQIDGSINPGNSGGPLIRIGSGDVIGIVTRTHTGLEKDFDKLVITIKENLKALEQAKGMMSMGGIDPIQATQATMGILGKLSFNLKRSANVGIGYAFSVEHISEAGLFN